MSTTEESSGRWRRRWNVLVWRASNRLRQPARFAAERWFRWRFPQTRSSSVLLLQAHMRSGSTLLLHLLAAHPQVATLGERNKGYCRPQDLDSLIAHAHLAPWKWLRPSPWVVDQLNHGHLLPGLQLLQEPGVHSVFLIREPRATIESIVATFQPLYGGWPVQRAAAYYSERMDSLAQAAGMVPSGRALALDFQELLDETATVLKEVAHFLGLTGGLPESYPRQRFTGRRGDPSSRIRAGRVLRSASEHVVEIPDGLLAQCREAYRRTRGRMARHWWRRAEGTNPAGSPTAPGC